MYRQTWQGRRWRRAQRHFACTCSGQHGLWCPMHCTMQRQCTTGGGSAAHRPYMCAAHARRQAAKRGHTSPSQQPTRALRGAAVPARPASAPPRTLNIWIIEHLATDSDPQVDLRPCHLLSQGTGNVPERPWSRRALLPQQGRPLLEGDQSNSWRRLTALPSRRIARRNPRRSPRRWPLFQPPIGGCLHAGGGP